MRDLLLSVDYIVIHNGSRWDLVHLQRLLEIEIKATIVDSLALSWYLFPERNRHGLEYWGEDFGIPKPKINDWINLTLPEYIKRCEEDVKINTRLWNMQWNKLKAIYNSEEDIWRFIKYLEFKMSCARKQEDSGWKIDKQFILDSIDKLEKERENRIDALRAAMPKVPISVTRSKPQNLYKADGTLSKRAEAWFDLLKQTNSPENSEEIEVILEHIDGNPSSTDQIKDWLFSLGWKPQTFKQNKKKEDVPQINQEHGKGICESIKKLFTKEPALENLDGLSILNHRIPLLKSFLEYENDGYVQAAIQGLTNTLRFQHAKPCVNMPKVEKPYGYEIRGSLIAPDGYELCGADMSGLEDRLKQHFIFPYDPEYVQKLMDKDYDPHITLAVMADMLRRNEADLYKILDKKEEKDKEEKLEYARIKGIRSIAKNGNYACQYNAYPPRLAITCGITLAKAKVLFDAYWGLNWSIKAVTKTLKTKEVGTQVYQYNPISDFWYVLRKENDKFSTLVQGTAAYVFDLWVRNVLAERDQLTGQFHDEIILTIKKGFRNECNDLLRRSIKITNEQLKLNRELDIGIQYGERYSDIH